MSNKKGIDCYVASRKLLLRMTDRIKRYKWCKERLHWSVEDGDGDGDGDDKNNNNIIVLCITIGCS